MKIIQCRFREIVAEIMARPQKGYKIKIGAKKGV